MCHSCIFMQMQDTFCFGAGLSCRLLVLVLFLESYLASQAPLNRLVDSCRESSAWQQHARSTDWGVSMSKVYQSCSALANYHKLQPRVSIQVQRAVWGRRPAGSPCWGHKLFLLQITTEVQLAKFQRIRSDLLVHWQWGSAGWCTAGNQGQFNAMRNLMQFWVGSVRFLHCGIHFWQDIAIWPAIDKTTGIIESVSTWYQKQNNFRFLRKKII